MLSSSPPHPTQTPPPSLPGCSKGGGGGGGGGEGGGAADPPPPNRHASRQHNNLYNFLLAAKVDKGCDFTHTSFLRPAGAFYVPASHAPEFFRLYQAAMENKEELYITEKHRHTGPVVVDLDFRFEHASMEDVAPQRTYTEAHVATIVQALCRCLAYYVAPPPEFTVYVMEKPAPVLQPKPLLVKDGIHIVVPGIVSRPCLQYLVREKLMADPELLAVLDSMAVVNRVDDVLDEAVIERNNWLMYGSKKPHTQPYRVTRTYSYTTATRNLALTKDATSDSGPLDARLVELLSIRNKHDETPIRDDQLGRVTEYQAQLDEKQRRKDALQKVWNVAPVERNTSKNFELAQKLVDIIGAFRVEMYQDWIRLGWCLRNIDHRLLEKWTEFSMKSPKYIAGECQRLWEHMRLGGLGIGTLHMWAKKDNPEAYRELMRNDLFELIRRSISNTHHDIARVVHQMYQYDYVCSSIRGRGWYEFREHRWRPSDSAIHLRVHMCEEVFNEYANVAISHQRQATDPSTADSDKTSHMEIAQKLNAIALKLKDTNFKDYVLKECCELFYQEKFEERLDSNPNLIGFENGVYDLENMEFREGRPDDFISFSCGINYVPYDKTHPTIKDVQRFWEQVQPVKEIRDYLLTVLSSFLCGNTREERFHIWTGSGSNGKSVVIDLFEKAFGDYTCKFPVTLLTGKRAASNAATSELARAKGKRFAVLQEPSEDEKLNIGLMKELTGGDKIMARAIYKEPIEFKPMFKMALLCNHLPNVPSDDGGTWRRIRVVEYTSKFVEHPTKENEFPMDGDLHKKFGEWAPHFMALLIEYYRAYSQSRLVEPAAVLACTRDYQKNNDHYADFADTCLTRGEADEFVQLNDLFQEFKDWVREDNIPIKVPKKKDVQAYMDKHLGRNTTLRGNVGYKGYRIKDRYAGADTPAAP